MSTKETIGPDAYARVFENHAEGRLILEDLAARFGGGIYVKGGLDGDRQTCFNAGRRSVLDFILGRINQANGVEDHESD